MSVAVEDVLRGRRSTGPAWLAVLQMAEDWGVPPWEIVNAPGSLRWARRWAIYRQALRRIQDDQRR